MPDLTDLDTFDQGLPPMDLLPPSEIRRRGDRMRRRRTALVAAGGVLAVALAVGVPAVALSGNDHGRRVEPAPRPSQTEPPRGWLGSVFDYPIESRFPTPFERVESSDPSLTPLCAETTAFGNISYVDEALVSYTGESEDRAQRWLIVFPDQQAAEDAMADARNVIRSCPSPSAGPHGLSTIYSEVPWQYGADDTFAWAEQVRHADGLLSDLTYVQAARTGNAVYVESSYTSAGGDAVIDSLQELLTQRSVEPLGLLCIYSVNPCLNPFAPGGAETGTIQSSIGPSTVTPAK